jgi:hypothetical protein
MDEGKEIYVLKWMPSGVVPHGGPAFTDKERAESCAKRSNKDLKWYHRLSGGMWVVSELKLVEGNKKVHKE